MFHIRIPMLRACGALGLLALASSAYAESLTLSQTVTQALKQDAWLAANSKQQQSAIALSQGALALPDPKISVGVLNMPTDTFDFEQEAMTQLSVQVTQMFPVGDSLQIGSDQQLVKVEQAKWQRANRVALLEKDVTRLWLSAYYYQQALQIVSQSKPLFEQLNDAVASNYRASYGSARQQDLLRAELELSKLDQRLIELTQARDNALNQLKQYLPQQLGEQLSVARRDQALAKLSINDSLSHEQIAVSLSHHPLVKLIDMRTDGAHLDQSLAEQKYKPQWGVTLGYGYRGDTPNGSDRADLASLAVSVSMPIFSTSRQDAEVSAARLQAEALASDRELLLNELLSRYQAVMGNWTQLKKREALYQTELLPKYHASSEAALNAYTRDDGRFVDIVQARIAELNAQVELLGIQVEQSKQAAELNYLITRHQAPSSKGEQL
ncbi:Outer membrane efflux protein [Marinomonas aquimarina]|uniref:Outer membrane efflux protein n=1 Tax=Marinomonas aquimarina TaxID=295068 RepID=A0A1A8TKI8_9GAMM|nr:TolC family protein [Marinomonas aquimarina]SBS33461.1 Outer membrane efflux protein [Marinomonas aquimarina]